MNDDPEPDQLVDVNEVYIVQDATGDMEWDDALTAAIKLIQEHAQRILQEQHALRMLHIEAEIDQTTDNQEEAK